MQYTTSIVPLYVLTLVLSFASTSCTSHHGLNCRGKAGRLQAAVADNDPAAVASILTDSEVDIYADCQDHIPPLQAAARKGYLKIVEILLDSGVAVDSRTNHATIPLHLAVQGGHEAVVRLLLDRDASVDSQDGTFGNTPLHWAGTYGYVSIAQLLLDKKAQVNSTNKYNATPLHRAAQYGHIGVVALLLSRGADLSSNNSAGQTALQLAQSTNRPEAAAFLKLAESKSKAWLEGYYRGFASEKKREKDEKKVHVFAEAYADIYEEEKDHDFADTYTPLYLQHIKTGNTPENAKNMAKVFVLEIMY